MTKEQSTSFMNILAGLLRFINEFKLPFQTIHALASFESVGRRVCREMKESMEQSAIVPSYSHGERDFMNQLGTLFPYGTGVIWGDCCGAVAYSPKIIGGCSIVGYNEVHWMGKHCQCDYSCGMSSGCLFTVELPLKIVMSKEAGASQKPVQHILAE